MSNLSEKGYEDCRQILYTFTTRKGKQIHVEILCKSLMEENVMLVNAFVDMYAKYDDLEKAQLVVDELPIQDLVSWN